MKPRWIDAAIGAALMWVAVAAQPFRGLNLWALWFVESTERWHADAASALVDPNGVFPLGPALAGLLGPDPLLAVRFVTATAAAAATGFVMSMASRAGGRWAAWVAFFALALQPRWWAVATVPTPSLVAAAGVAALWSAALVARDDARWTPVALIGVMAGLTSGLPAWTTLPVVAWLVMLRPGASQSGVARMRPVGAWMLALPVFVAGAWFVVFEAVNTGGAKDAIEAVGHWLRLPAEPFAASGRLFGPERFTLGAALGGAATLAMRKRATLSERDADVRQEVLAFAAWAFVLPTVLRSPFHGGLDLSVFWAMAVSVLAGVFVAALRQRLARNVLLAAVAATLVISAADVARAGGTWEAYRAFGAHRAAASGLGRYPHGPVPPAVLTWATDLGARRFALLTNAWEMTPVVRRYQAMGLLPADVAVVGVEEADAVVLSLDDGLPELYPVAADWAWSARATPELVRTIRAMGLDVFGAAYLGER